MDIKTDSTPFPKKGDIKMIAHRGLSGLERENTCAAFVAAGVKSYYGIETDVHVTKDKKFICVHDDDLKRIANLDWVVEETPFDMLRSVRLTDVDGRKREDLCLPSLEEYFAVCKKYQKKAVLELKNPMDKDMVWAIAETAVQMQWFENVIFISFAAENLVALREKYPTATAQFLTETATDEEIRFMIDNRLDADLCGYCVTKEKVDALHKAGLKVNVWTLDTIEHAQMAKACGVDFITSNILE